MKKARIWLFILGLFVAVLGQSAMAETGGWYMDDDGDGIPNCLDPDWYAPEDGTGYQHSGPPSTTELTTTTIDGDLGGTGDCTQDMTQDMIQDKLQDKLQDGSCQE